MWQDTRRLVILLFIPGAIYGAGVQECYVCRPDGEPSAELEKQFPNEELPVCGAKTPERKVCPPGSRGCLTQYEGHRVTKSCSDLFVNDCRQANHVKYCYCSGTLCNVEERVITITPETDDEDMPSEGSGEGTTTLTTPSTTTTVKTLKPPQQSSTCSTLETPALIFLIGILLFQLF